MVHFMTETPKIYPWLRLCFHTLGQCSVLQCSPCHQAASVCFIRCSSHNLMRPTPANDLELNRIFLSGLGSDTFYQIQIQIRFPRFYQIQIQIRFPRFYQIQIQIRFQIFYQIQIQIHFYQIQIQIQIHFRIFYQIQIQIHFQIFYQILIHFGIFCRYTYVLDLVVLNCCDSSI